MSAISYMVFYWQPITGLFLGLFLFASVIYANYNSSIKSRIIRWIARRLFGNELGSDLSANSLFSVLSSFVVVAAWIWTGLAVMYLWNA
jgi:hypothetical protein